MACSSHITIAEAILNKSRLVIHNTTVQCSRTHIASVCCEIPNQKLSQLTVAVWVQWSAYSRTNR